MEEMGGSDENNPSRIMKQSSVQGGMPVRGGKVMAPIGHNRRALKERNGNNIGAPPYPAVVNKGAPLGLGVTRKDVGSENLQPIAGHGHRPVTRKLAAQTANSQQQECVLEEPKKRNQLGMSSSTSEDFDDCVILDMNEYKAGNDMSVPMFVQHTEAMLEEIDRMDEEIEMEDIDEQILDIDSGDKNNALTVTEYVDDIYSYYKKVESTSCVPPDYMDRQPDINGKMRAILIDWLIEVHYKFELMEETLYLTVNLIDRFLASQPVARKKLQLVGVTAMLVACKYEEVSVPVVEDLILISDKAYSRQDVLAMERLMINALQFNLSVPTPYVFMRRFLKAAEADEKLELLSFFMIELSLVEYEVLRFPPSLLAAAAVFTAQCTVNGSEHWNKTCEWHTGYSQQQLMDCSWLMVTFHQKAATGKLTGVHRKYSLSRFGYVANCNPALFLLETAMGFDGWTCLN